MGQSACTYLLGCNPEHKPRCLRYRHGNKVPYLHNKSLRKTRPVEDEEVEWATQIMHRTIFQAARYLPRKIQQTSNAVLIHNSSWGQSTGDPRRRLPGHHMFLHSLPRNRWHIYCSMDLHTTNLSLWYSNTNWYPTKDVEKCFSNRKLNYCHWISG